MPSLLARSRPQTIRCRFGLLAPTEALQEGWWLGILDRLILCSDILYGLDSNRRSPIPPEPCSRIWQGPKLCPGILNGPDPSVLLNWPHRGLSILRNRRAYIFHGPPGLDLCPCIV